MIIYNGKMQIDMEEDLAKLKEEIAQLKTLEELITTSPKYVLLDGKTQMIDEKSEIEVRSRLEHSMNVASISKRIIGKIYDLCSIKKISDTKLFKLNKQRAMLYAVVMSLSHDLGHTPFGHAGEAIVNEFMQSISDKEVINRIIQNRIKYFGKCYEEQQGHTEEFEGRVSFEHNEQSVIEFYKIIEQSGENFDRVDIKRIVNGILAHSITRVPEPPSDIIGQIIRQTDKIEYRNKDFDEIIDYIKFGMIGDEELLKYISMPSNLRIRQIIEDIAKEAIETGHILDDNKSLSVTRKLRDIYQNVIYLLDLDGKRGLLTGNNRERNQLIYKRLLEYYYKHIDKIPTKTLTYNNPINTDKENKRVLAFDRTKLQDQTDVELVISYLTTFTNVKCESTYRRLVKERISKGPNYGIEPVTQAEIEERKKKQIQERILKMRAKDIYKGLETHTDAEYLIRLRMEDARFIRNYLTDEAIQKMNANRIKQENENEQDKLMYESMIQADNERLLRSNNRKQKREENEQGGQEGQGGYIL